jgi:hypothetical protein
MKSYLRVKWKHSSSTYPILLYSELDSERWETRKIEVYANGRCGFASASGAAGGAQLGKCPVPTLTEIASDPQFEPVEITRAEFEELWLRRL